MIEFIKKVFGRRKEAELTAQQVLGGLPDDYTVLSTVLYDSSAIDHIVFSKMQGLFLVNVVADTGTVSYDGTHLQINKRQRSDSIKKTLKDTFWLKSTLRERIGLDVPITPVVVFERARVDVNQLVIGVTVIESKDLLGSVLNAPVKKTLEDGVLIVLRELHGTRTISYRNL